VASLDTKRLAFGSVAAQYDRARPSYPAAVIDSFVAALPPAEGFVLEVGAGTGKATVLLAERGLDVVGLEPDPRMARLARAACAEYPRVTIETVDFERWRGPGRARAIVSAQAWHWVDAATRYELARDRLVDDGLLAAIWTVPDWSRIALRGALQEVYARCVPDLEPAFPMHPASPPTTIVAPWREEIEAAPGLVRPDTFEHEWQCDYSARAYAEMIATHQDHVLLDDRARRELLGAIEAAIDARGGSIAVAFRTRLCTARRSHGAQRDAPD